jgi:hypothetical protein
MPDDECKIGYEKVNKRQIRAAIWGFNDKRTKIVPKTELAKTESFKADWDTFVESLPAKEALYCCYDFEFKDIQSGYNDGDLEAAPVKSKMTLITWAPDAAKPNVKMLVPSSVAGVKAICDSVQASVQMNCMEDALYENVCDKLGIKLPK